MTRIKAISQQNGGGLKTAFLVLAVLALALGLLAALSGTAAAAGSTIAVDMMPAASGPSSSGGIDACRQVNAGDEFDADITISNAQSIVAWELRVDYNPDVVSLVSADDNQFLAKDGGSAQFILFEQESAGRKFLAATDNSAPDSGSGVLSRLHFRALKDGTSPVTVVSSPAVFGPRLTSAGGSYFGDSNGDGIYDGALTGGSIAVGRSCGASTPVVTSTPVHTTATPKPGAKTPAPSGGTHQTPAPAASGNAGSDGVDGSSTDAGNTGGGSQGGSSPAPSDLVNNVPGGNSGNGPNAGGNSAANGGGAGSQSGGDGSGDANSSSTSSAGSGSSTNLVLIIAAAFAALTVISGAGLLIMRNRISR